MTATTELLPIHMFNGWLARGERGLSSEAIVTHLTGTHISTHRSADDYPHDPSDFRRCQLLLEAVPMARVTFRDVMREVSPQWQRLVDAWDDIHDLSEDEVPGYLNGATGNAPRTYQLMRRTIAGGTECTACDGSGNGRPCEKCKGTGRRGGGRCRAPQCYRGFAFCQTCRGRGYTLEVTR
jgi:hypothetical protein